MEAIQNPIKKIREELHLTQKEAANIAGVTEQVILKTEQGLYPTIGPSVLLAFQNLSSLSVGLIEAMYEDWINQELRKVKLPVGYTAEAWRSPLTFGLYLSLVCGLNDVPASINSFCKLFKINPYVIQKYEAGKMKQTPLQLVERIAYIRGEF